MTEFICEVKLEFGGNNFESNSKEEYIEKVKEHYWDEFGIELTDDEIVNIREFKVGKE
tara:strand:- start:1239 stop:1412 length:174 start_codon:yes stop_codon:yes gene_type:complete